MSSVVFFLPAALSWWAKIIIIIIIKRFSSVLLHDTLPVDLVLDLHV